MKGRRTRRKREEKAAEKVSTQTKTRQMAHPWRDADHAVLVKLVTRFGHDVDKVYESFAIYDPSRVRHSIVSKLAAIRNEPSARRKFEGEEYKQFLAIVDSVRKTKLKITTQQAPAPIIKPTILESKSSIDRESTLAEDH